MRARDLLEPTGPVERPCSHRLLAYKHLERDKAGNLFEIAHCLACWRDVERPVSSGNWRLTAANLRV